MKKLNIVLATTVAVSSFVYAGGDFVLPVFETEEVYVPVEPVVEEPVEVVTVPKSLPAPVEIEAPTPAPAPVEIPAPVAVPVPVPVPEPLPVKVLEQITPLGFYVALGLTAARYEPNCGCRGTGAVDKTAGIVGRAGYDFNEFVGVEARGIRTNWKADGGKFKHYGIFVKPMYPVSKDINIYGLAGLAQTKTENRGRRQFTDANGFAWGAGLEYDLGSDHAKEGRYSRAFDGYGDQEGGWGLFADYERLLQKSGSPDLDAISAGVTYDF